MKTAIAIACLAAVSHVAGAAPKSIRLFVSPSGNDAWSGRRATPQRDGRDGPFATVQRAVEEIRRLNRLRSTRVPIDVVMAGGTYRLDAPIVVTPDASGSPGAPVTFMAARGARPVLSGGERITGWQVTPQGWWSVQLPDVEAGRWRFMQLFVNGSRRYRTRLPREGFLTIEKGLAPTEANASRGFDRFQFRAGDVRSDWHALADVEVLGFQTWTMARLPIASVDDGSRIVTFTGTTSGTAGYMALPEGNRYQVENVREALGEPGRFYLERATGALTYVPMPGEKPETAEVIAPRIEQLVVLSGEPSARRWVEHVVFRGLSFEHTNWVTPPAGNATSQAEMPISAAISAVGARDCRFDQCRVAHIGNYAIELGQGCKRCRIENCELVDMGAGGVKLGEPGPRDDEELVASHNVVHNNRIAHGGRLHPAAIGVWLGHTPYNEVTHNDIFDFYYTGVSVGWSWGYGRSLCNHNRIADNHIHTIGQGLLSDMGAIYTLGLAPGTVLRGNRIHDIESFGYGGWGIYFDEGTTGMLAEDNVVYRTKSAGFHQHYGMNNLVRNNVFALGREAQLMRTRAEEHLSFTFERNIVYWTDGALLGSNWSGNNYRLDYNLYWNAKRKPFDFAKLGLAKWQAKGQDAHSIVEDPRFVAPGRGDFRLQPGSPAVRIGFRPIDVSRAGCSLRTSRSERGATIAAFPPVQPK